MNIKKANIVFVLITLLLTLQSQSHAADSSRREIIGRWVDISIKTTMEIYRQADKFYIFSKFYDGSTLTQELKKEKKDRKTVYRKIGSGQDYYIINKDYHLEAWDELGLIHTAKPKK